MAADAWVPMAFFHISNSFFARGSGRLKKITKQSQLEYRPSYFNNLTHNRWGEEKSRSAGLGRRLAQYLRPFPIPRAETLDTLAILKGGKRGGRGAARRAKKKYETKPISSNPFTINGLRWSRRASGHPRPPRSAAFVSWRTHVSPFVATSSPVVAQALSLPRRDSSRRPGRFRRCEDLPVTGGNIPCFLQLLALLQGNPIPPR